jgi:phosphatidylglycerophosphate synthase
MRLVVSTGQNIVIAANYLGKIKTVSQIVFVSTVFLEPVVQLAVKYIVNLFTDWNFEVGKYIPLSYLSIAFAVFMTVWSGLNYIKGYWKYLDPQK